MWSAVYDKKKTMFGRYVKPSVINERSSYILFLTIFELIYLKYFSIMYAFISRGWHFCVVFFLLITVWHHVELITIT
jgi:hypothetical protein